jgi:hypothetical protein
MHLIESQRTPIENKTRDGMIEDRLNYDGMLYQNNYLIIIINDY